MKIFLNKNVEDLLAGWISDFTACPVTNEIRLESDDRFHYLRMDEGANLELLQTVTRRILKKIQIHFCRMNGSEVFSVPWSVLLKFQKFKLFCLSGHYKWKLRTCFLLHRKQLSYFGWRSIVIENTKFYENLLH